MRTCRLLKNVSYNYYTYKKMKRKRVVRTSTLFSQRKRFGNNKKRRVQKRIGGLSNLEIKFVDNSASHSLITRTAQIDVLNIVDQGNGPSERNGREITMKTIQLSCAVSEKVGSVPTIYRFKLVFDKSTNGAAAAGGDILSNGGTALAPLGYNNLDNRNRFVTLWDSGPFEAEKVGNNNANKTFQVFQKINYSTIYSGTGGGVGNIKSGGLLLMLVCNNSVTTQNHTIYYTARLRYNDGRLMGKEGHSSPKMKEWLSKL